MSAAVQCEFCQDTARLKGSYELDCQHCNVAVERMALDRFIGNWCKQPENMLMDRDFAAYMHGKAAGAAQAVPAGWQPIETAPKSMTSCLYLVGRYCVQGFVDATGEIMVQSEVSPHWRRMRGKPTHWMPLPAAPKAP